MISVMDAGLICEVRKMTKQEKIIVSTYTGVLMCNFDDVHEYIQKKLGRPVFSHELADKDIQKEIKEKSKEEFLEICNREEPEDVVGIINNSVDNALTLLDSIYSSGRMMYYSDYCALHDAIAGALAGGDE